MATRARGGRGPDIKDLPPFEGRVHKWIRKQVPVPRAAKSLDNTHKLELLRWCLQSEEQIQCWLMQAAKHRLWSLSRRAPGMVGPMPIMVCTCMNLPYLHYVCR